MTVSRAIVYVGDGQALPEKREALTELAEVGGSIAWGAVDGNLIWIEMPVDDGVDGKVHHTGEISEGSRLCDQLAANAGCECDQDCFKTLSSSCRRVETSRYAGATK